MADRSPDGRDHAAPPEPVALPPPEVVEFIRFAHRRRRAGWPEIYDDMWAVAARREFRGWDHARLADAGIMFSLFDTPRLAAWVRAVLVRDDAAASPGGDRRTPGEPGEPSTETPAEERSRIAR